MQERRRSTRTRCYLGGQIAFNNRNALMDCLVRNVTVEGAKLVFSQTVTVPDQFDLYVRKREQSFQARIAWRRDDEIGVALLPQRPSTAIPLDIARRLRDCEAENLALKRRLALLTETE